MTAMLMTSVAYVLPTFLVFIFEVSSRSLFLRSKQSTKKSGSAVCRYACGAFRVAVLATVSLVLATWFLLSLLRNALHEWGQSAIPSFSTYLLEDNVVQSRKSMDHAWMMRVTLMIQLRVHKVTLSQTLENHPTMQLIVHTIMLNSLRLFFPVVKCLLNTTEHGMSWEMWVRVWAVQRMRSCFDVVMCNFRSI